MVDTRESYINFDRVEVHFSEFVAALRGVSLKVNRGEFVFLVGKTGAGKSTLLKLLSREVRETAGVVKLDGIDLGKLSDAEIPTLRQRMGIVPQDFGLLPNKCVFENVAYAMRALGATKRQVRQRVPEILELVNIGHRADAFPAELSGGEQQRVAIGRALINRPTLLIADEPTGNLDPEHSMEIIDLLTQLNERGTTVLVASHDMMVIERTNKRVVRLENGLIIEDLPPEIMEAPIKEGLFEEIQDDELEALGEAPFTEGEVEAGPIPDESPSPLGVDEILEEADV